MSEISMRDQWARSLVRNALFEELQLLKQKAPEGHQVGAAPLLGAIPIQVPFKGLISPGHLPQDPDQGADAPRSLPPRGTLPDTCKVCIVGAGVTGLYIAMILDDLAIPGLSYEILEASPRVGGRLYTYHFSDTKNDYYDIGAMRYPKLDVMGRTFDLFKKLGIYDSMIPYMYDTGTVCTPSRFNDIVVLKEDPATEDPFKVSVANKGSVPDKTIKRGVDDILKEAFGKYQKKLADNWDEGMKELLEQDKYTTREYIRDNLKDYGDFYSIQWLETQNTSSNLFDQAFTESVIDSFDFGQAKEWLCIPGGTSLVTDGMVAKIKVKPETEKPVRRIWLDRSKKDDANIFVECLGEKKRRDPYVTVFNTASLGCQQRMDLTGLELHPTQKDAIRCLHYDDSAKCAIKFSYPWWIVDCGITAGGLASSDLPIRTCVYPSYNLNDDKTKPAILLCSYTWAQDAVRMSSLISRDSPRGEEELKDVLLDGLAKLHARSFKNTVNVNEIRALIAKAYVTHHAFSWSYDPYMSGAFALFGPGQFANFYPYLTRPAADSKYHFVGEACSSHHAWIVGSLDSAVAAIAKFLKKYNIDDTKFRKNWGAIPELERGKDGFMHLQVMLGALPEDKQVQVKLM